MQCLPKGDSRDKVFGGQKVRGCKICLLVYILGVSFSENLAPCHGFL